MNPMEIPRVQEALMVLGKLAELQKIDNEHFSGFNLAYGLGKQSGGETLYVKLSLELISEKEADKLSRKKGNQLDPEDIGRQFPLNRG